MMSLNNQNPPFLKLKELLKFKFILKPLKFFKTLKGFYGWVGERKFGLWA